MAWLSVQREVCPRCGTTEADWLDPKTRLPHEVPKWEAMTFRCHGCAELAKAEKQVPEREAGVRIVLVPFKDDDKDEDDDDGW